MIDTSRLKKILKAGRVTIDRERKERPAKVNTIHFDHNGEPYIKKADGSWRKLNQEEKKKYLGKAAYSAGQAKAMNATSRDSGAVGGSKALVPKHVRKVASKGDSILDYGAGRNAAHTKSLKSSGHNVTAWEIGDNFQDGVHDKGALGKKYKVVFASNVLNVQPSKDKLMEVLREIKKVLQGGGTAIVNYPQEPRKSNVSTDQINSILENMFSSVEKVGDGVYKLQKAGNIMNGIIHTGGVMPLIKGVSPETYEHPDKPGAGAKKRKKLKSPDDKVEAVMGEFKRGKLRSGSGEKVTDKDQALAIAMSEAGKGNKATDNLRDLLKAKPTKYKKRYRGKGGKWQYEYHKPGEKMQASKLEDKPSALEQKQGDVAYERVISGFFKDAGFNVTNVKTENFGSLSQSIKDFTVTTPTDEFSLRMTKDGLIWDDFSHTTYLGKTGAEIKANLKRIHDSPGKIPKDLQQSPRVAKEQAGLPPGMSATMPEMSDEDWEKYDQAKKERQRQERGEETPLKYTVVDNEFNRKNYPELIGKTFDKPPGYAAVKVAGDTREISQDPGKIKERKDREAKLQEKIDKETEEKSKDKKRSQGSAQEKYDLALQDAQIAKDVLNEIGYTLSDQGDIIDQETGTVTFDAAMKNLAVVLLKDIYGEDPRKNKDEWPDEDISEAEQIIRGVDAVKNLPKLKDAAMSQAGQQKLLARSVPMILNNGMPLIKGQDLEKAAPKYHKRYRKGGKWVYEYENRAGEKRQYGEGAKAPISKKERAKLFKNLKDDNVSKERAQSMLESFTKEMKEWEKSMSEKWGKVPAKDSKVGWGRVQAIKDYLAHLETNKASSVDSLWTLLKARQKKYIRRVAKPGGGYKYFYPEKGQKVQRSALEDKPKEKKGEMKVAGKTLRIFDNGGDTADRYTVIIGNDVFGMGDKPKDPGGFNQYSGDLSEFPKDLSHLGKELTSVPDNLKEAIAERAKDDDDEMMSKEEKAKLHEKLKETPEKTSESMEGQLQEFGVPEEHSKHVAEFMEDMGFEMDELESIQESGDGFGYNIEVAGEEYFMAPSEDEAFAAAKQDLEYLIDDMGVTAFNEDFWTQHIDEDRLGRELAMDSYSYFDDGHDDPEYYLDEEPAGEDGDWTDEQRQKAGEASEEAFVERVTDDPLGYLDEIYGKGSQEYSKFIENYVDQDALIEEAINVDGIAHTLGRYDGEEHVYGDLHFYRTN